MDSVEIQSLLAELQKHKTESGCRRGRPRKYATDEEANRAKLERTKQAHQQNPDHYKAYQSQYYQKKKAERLAKQELVNRLISMYPQSVTPVSI